MGTENIVYKKHSKLYRIVGILLAVAVIGMGYFLFNFLTTRASSSVVPEGYKFSLVEKNEDNGRRMTYYIYDDKIWTEDVRSQSDKTVMLYDNIETDGLELEDDDPENCEIESCKAYAKVLKDVKKLLQNQIGKQQLRF